MEIALAAIADSANVSREGKLNLLGVFDSIRTKTIPTTHPSMAFAFRVRFEHQDQQQRHRLEVRLIDMDGRPLFTGTARVEVGRIPPGQFVHSSQVLQINNLEFQKAGRYRFRITSEGQEKPFDTVFQVLKVEG